MPGFFWAKMEGGETKMTTERIAVISMPDGELKDIIILDNGEGYDENGIGQTPNHDKVEIIYVAEKEN